MSGHRLSAWAIAMLLGEAHVVPMKSLPEISLKASAGGLFVMVCALAAETVEPKRLAGVFAAAPSVALAGLILTGVQGRSRGPGRDPGLACRFALTTALLLRHRSAWLALVVATAAWTVASLGKYAVVRAAGAGSDETGPEGPGA